MRLDNGFIVGLLRAEAVLFCGRLSVKLALTLGL